MVIHVKRRSIKLPFAPRETVLAESGKFAVIYDNPFRRTNFDNINMSYYNNTVKNMPPEEIAAVPFSAAKPIVDSYEVKPPGIPFFVPQQTEFVSSSKVITLNHQVRGGNGPYEYFLVTESQGMSMNPETGQIVVQREELPIEPMFARVPVWEALMVGGQAKPYGNGIQSVGLNTYPIPRNDPARSLLENHQREVCRGMFVPGRQLSFRDCRDGNSRFKGDHPFGT